MGTLSKSKNIKDTNANISSDDEDDENHGNYDDLSDENDSIYEANVEETEEEDNESDQEDENIPTNNNTNTTLSTYTKIENIPFINTNNNQTAIYYNLPPFNNEKVGVRLLNHMENSPIAFFAKLISNNIIDIFCDNTNLFATTTNKKQWVDLKSTEFRQFLSIILYMGLCKLNNRSDYWDSPDFNQQFVKDKMSQSRFNSILSCLHYTESSKYTKEEKKEMNKEDPFWLVAKF